MCFFVNRINFLFVLRKWIYNRVFLVGLFFVDVRLNYIVLFLCKLLKRILFWKERNGYSFFVRLNGL